MFCAIVDHRNHMLTLNNMPSAGHRRRVLLLSQPEGAPQRRRTGYLCCCRRTASSVSQAASVGHQARVPQLASPVPVTPFARLRVAPRSFPFLDQIRGHDDERLADYARAVMAAASWPD
jgi:hypothetical protein